MLETEGDFQCHMKDCAAIGEGRKLLINEQFCAMEDIVVEDADQCIRGAPDNYAEGAVCANDGTATEAFCSYDVGSKACARCNDWYNYGPKCLQPDVTISQGLCSGSKWSTSSCRPKSVAVDWYGSQWAKHLGEVETAEECATWTKNFCNFVGGTVKTDACAPGGPYCDTMDSWWDTCHSDAYCAGWWWATGHPALEKYCCYSQAPRLESWSAKLCDGANVKGQALVRPCLN